MNNLNQDIRERLEKLAEPKYRDFSQALIPGVDNMLGVRLPKLRVIAKDLAKGDWQAYLKDARDDSFEEVMLQGLTIGYVKGEIDEILPFVEVFIPKIDNWSVNDSFCTSLKVVQMNQDRVWIFLQNYLHSDKEYDNRVAIILLMDYYLDDTHIDEVLEICNRIHHEGYYVKMAVAWTLATAYSKYPKKTEELLLKNELDDFTHNKAIQKMIESYRISNEEKQKLRNLKRLKAEKKCGGDHDT